MSFLKKIPNSIMINFTIVVGIAFWRKPHTSTIADLLKDEDSLRTLLLNKYLTMM